MKQLLFIASFVLAACSSAPEVVNTADPFSGSGDRAIYVANHGWHTGVVVPAAVLPDRLQGVRARFPSADWFEFGWGDKDFYQAKEMTAGLALQAALWPTDTVVRVVSLPRDLPRYFANAGVVKLCATDAELMSLVDFISRSFARDSKGNVRPEAGTATSRSQFYAGSGQYHLMNTCNTWTAKGLASLGMDVSTTLKLTAGSVMDYLRDNSDAEVLSALDDADTLRSSELRCGP